MNEARKRILVVDDDVTFRTRLVRALSMRGYEASEAGDAGSAVEQARRAKPGRAIVDLRMPGKSGVDLIPELVAIDPAMQILVLTGYGSIATAIARTVAVAATPATHRTETSPTALRTT